MRKKSIRILAIETSCDDTCVAIMSGLKILSNIVSSQEEIHKKYGGVYPTLAKREHQKNLPLVLKQALKETNLSKPDYIAVTIGPGLEPCLWTGINFAKDLAQRWNVKIIPVNHIEAHILVNFQFSIRQAADNFQKYFPAIALVISGGHTQLILMKGIGKYRILGETRDDAAGECFDKTARILGLGYPGGPAIAASAAKIKNLKLKIKNYSLPRPMIYSKDYDFSFSGLKTAVLYKFKSCEFKQAMAKEIQQAIIDVLVKKTLKAAKDYKAKTVILGGGVAANQELRRQFSFPLILMPDSEFCTDNAVMVGITAFFHQKEAKNWKNIKANANLKIS